METAPDINTEKKPLDSIEGVETVETVEVQALNTRVTGALYKKREKIYPRRVRGTFRSLKWLVMTITLAIYYLAPWLRWDRGAEAPGQAILLDIPGGSISSLSRSGRRKFITLRVSWS